MCFSEYSDYKIFLQEIIEDNSTLRRIFTLNVTTTKFYAYLYLFIYRLYVQLHLVRPTRPVKFTKHHSKQMTQQSSSTVVFLRVRDLGPHTNNYKFSLRCFLAVAIIVGGDSISAVQR
jgi:hypothetical protein